MSATRIHIFLAFSILCCLPAETFRFGRPTAGAQERSIADRTSPEAAVDTQLQINETTLLEGKSEKYRIDAASLLLASDEPAAREFLLGVLRRTDNAPARAAVCDALNPARVWLHPLKNKEDFIQPLLAILTTEEDPEIAKRAAEATLIFGYSQVQQELEKAVTDPALSVNARLNVIYALKRHPDKAAVAKLISLLGNPDRQIVEAARGALVSVGISVSADPAAQRQMLAELQQRGVETFLRERTIRQETRVRELERDLGDWQKRYMKALSDLHDSLPNDAAKIQFLQQQLSAQEVAVRSWALDKLQELRNAKGTLKLADLEPDLVKRVSDPSREVRLKTARILAVLSELNTSEALLEQLRVEQDEQIMPFILVALGEACYAGSMPNAGRKVPDEIRKETLDWAVRFLKTSDVEKTRSGAAVLGKLLEQDGLKPEDVERDLKALSDRYAQMVPGVDPALRGYLLGTMAGLCSTRSVCREQAIRLYTGYFDQALTDKTDLIRQNAVDGWGNIDKVGALRKFRENNVAADSNPTIRQKVIDLAGDVGGPQDLQWLAEKVGVPGDGEPAWAWQAMLKIFKSPRSDMNVLSDWTTRIEVLAAAGKVTVDQRIAFFALVEQRAQSENRADLLKPVRWNLAQLYVLSNNLKQASECYKILLGTATTEEDRQRLYSQLLRLYLALPDMDQASELISKCLSVKDLDPANNTIVNPNNVVVRSIEEYLNDPKTANPGAVVAMLQQVKLKDAGVARVWKVLLTRWERFAKAKKPEDDGRANN
jgi:HEAT repeat protein